MIRSIKLNLGDGGYAYLEPYPGSPPSTTATSAIRFTIGKDSDHTQVIIDKDDAEAIQLALKHMTS